MVVFFPSVFSLFEKENCGPLVRSGQLFAHWLSSSHLYPLMTFLPPAQGGTRSALGDKGTSSTSLRLQGM